MNFSVLGADPIVVRRYASWVASTAPQEPLARAEAAARLTKYASHRALHAESEQEQLWEFRTFAGAIGLLPSTGPDAMSTGLASLASSPLCGGYAAFAGALAGADRGQRREVEMALFSAIAASYSADAEAAANFPNPELAAVALQELAYEGQLSVQAMTGLGDLIRARDLAGSAIRPAFDLLAAIAPVQPLPAKLKDALLQRLEDGPLEEFDFVPLECFRVLASNHEYLAQQDIMRLKSWAASEQANQYTMSDFHAGLGFLALATPSSSGELSREQSDLLLGYLSPASRFPVEATTYSGTMVIAATGDEAIVALGRVLESGQRLSEESVEQLANIAQGRPDLAGRPALIAGHAAYWYVDVPPARLADRIARRLTRARSDSARRALEAEAAATMMASKPADVRDNLLESLNALWDEEIEPELRQALAATIALATLPRPKDMSAFAFEEPL